MDARLGKTGFLRRKRSAEGVKRHRAAPPAKRATHGRSRHSPRGLCVWIAGRGTLAR